MTTPQLSQPPQRSAGITRGITVIIMLLGGVLALIGATQSWVTATGFEAAHIHSVELSGQEASPVITAMALVTVAAGAALSIARRIGRWIIGIVVVLAAITMGLTTINVALNPTDAVAQKIAETTGTTGIADIAPSIEVSMLPWLTVIGALIGLAGGIIALTAGGHWPVGKTKKYDVGVQQRTDRNGPLDEIDTWDELSRGQDPT